MTYSPMIAMPHVIVNHEEGNYPLTSIGIQIMKNMKMNYPNRYWELAFSGVLMKTISERQEELLELKFMLLDEMEKKFPRPITDQFSETAKHMNNISDIVDQIMEQYITMPI